MIFVKVRDYFKKVSGEIMEITFGLTIFNSPLNMPSFSFISILESKNLENPLYDKDGIIIYETKIEFY